MLESDTVQLMPFELEHLSDLADVAYDMDIWQWTSPHIRSAEDLQQYGDDIMQYRSHKQRYPFSIVEKASGKVIGVTAYMNVSAQHNRLEIGSTWLGKGAHQTGLNRESKFLLLHYAFEKLEVRRVEFKTDRLNKRSIRAILKLGAKEEGILRSHMVMPGGRVRDTVYFSILNHEWEKVKKAVFSEQL